MSEAWLLKNRRRLRILLPSFFLLCLAVRRKQRGFRSGGARMSSTASLLFRPIFYRRGTRPTDPIIFLPFLARSPLIVEFAARL